MSETPPLVEIPRKKRKYVRRKPRVQKIAGTVKPEPAIPPAAPPRPRYGAPKALAEVDSQLEQAIVLIAKFEGELGELEAQSLVLRGRVDGYRRRIGSLLDLQRQLDGDGAVNLIRPDRPDLDPRMVAMMPAAPMFGEVPQGVASIPARQPKPTPNGNAAEQVKGEAGWK